MYLEMGSRPFFGSNKGAPVANIRHSNTTGRGNVNPIKVTCPHCGSKIFIYSRSSDPILCCLCSKKF